MSAKSIALFNAYRQQSGRPVPQPVNIRGTLDKSKVRAAVAAAWKAQQQQSEKKS